MPIHEIPSAGGGGGAFAGLVEGDVFSKSGAFETVTATDGEFSLEEDGTWSDPGGWWDDEEGSLVLPAGLYQLDVMASLGGSLADAWRLVVMMAGDTVSREILIPSGAVFETFHCAHSAVLQLPEPVFVTVLFGRETTTSAACSLSFRVAELVGA